MTQALRRAHDKVALARSALFSTWTARLMRVWTPAPRNGYRHSDGHYLGDVTTPNGGESGRKGDNRTQAAGAIPPTSVALPKNPSRRLASSTGCIQTGYPASISET